MSARRLQLRSFLGTCTAGALLVLLASLLLLRCLPAHRAPVSVDPLYADAEAVPFSTVRPEGFEADNPYTSDTAMVFYPWLAYMAREVALGELPLWSPLCGGGLPMMGNLSASVFFPTTWFSFVPEIGVARGMFWAALTKLIVAGLSGYLLLRRLGANWPGSLLAGFGFMAFGYQIVWLNYSLTNVSCLLPLALWVADRFVERSSVGRGAALAAVLALQFLGGHAETSLALGIAVVLWIGNTGGARALLRLVPYGILSLLWCAFQLLPFVEYLALSQGQFERLAKGDPQPLHLRAFSPLGITLGLVAIGFLYLAKRCIAGSPDRTAGQTLLRVVGAGVLLGGCALLWERLGSRALAVLLLDPDAYGRASRVDPFRGPEFYPDVNGGYVGVVILALGVLYVLIGNRRDLARFVGLSVALGLGFAANVEPLASLLRAVPPFDLAAGTRMLPLFACGVIVGAGLSVSEMTRDGTERWRATLLRMVLAVALATGISRLELGAGGVAGHDAPPKSVAHDLPLGRIVSPRHGAELEPIATQRGGSALRIEFEGIIESSEAPSAVAFVVGDRRLEARLRPAPTTKPDAGTASRVTSYVFESTWLATRAEAGTYRAYPEVDGRRGEPIEFEIGRRASLDASGWLRVVLALACVVLAAWRPRFAIGLPLYAAFELWRFGEPYNPATPIEQVFPRTELTDFLQRAADESIARGDGPIRVLFEDVILQPNMNQAYGIEVVRAYDQLEFRPFRRLLSEWIEPQVPFVQYNRDTVALGSPFADLFNITYVVTGRPLDIDGFAPVFESEAGRGGRVYANLDASRRAFLAERAVDLRGLSHEELGGFDPRRTAFLETTPPPTGPGGELRFVSYSAHRVEIEVRSTVPSILVLTDNDYPGWVATVDGADAPVLRSHGAFRAVAVPAGTRQVVFQYRSGSFRLGLALFAVGLLWVGFLVFRSKGRNAVAQAPDGV